MTTITRTCRECGRDFPITESEQEHLKATFARLGHRFVLPSRCKPCRQFRRDETFTPPAPTTPGDDIAITCRDCHTPFTFDRGEQQFFADRGLSQPSRCRPCRRARTAQRYEVRP